MECNKEEAVRVKELAEKKMETKDFVGAKKFALKAQKLFSDLDNISQILTVCDVHCAAGIKVNGEMDWYGILQVEQTADDTSIKKQYRKLALLLHPDKNKFAGAEAAFKLIGEAHMTLADKAKRSVYDMKRRSNVLKVMPRPAQQSNMASFTRKQPGPQNNFTNAAGFAYGNVSQQQSSETFWTICPHCFMKFQYVRMVLNKSLRCNRCMLNFVAYELNEQYPPHHWGGYAHVPNHYQNMKREVPVQASSAGNFPRPSGVNVAHNDIGSSNRPKEENAACAGSRTDGEVKPEKVKTAKPSSMNQRRKKGRKRVVESSDSDSSTDIEEFDVEDEVNGEEQNGGSTNEHYRWRSSRKRQNVTYDERGIEDDDEFVSLSKRSKKNEHSANNCNGNNTKATPESEEMPKAGTSLNVDQPPTSFLSPDSEFFDFEKERDPNKFAADQIWAVYDDADAMPRFYARIREVRSPFKVFFTWLEHEPLTDLEQVWTSEELPVACGNYKLGKRESTTSLEMFSHFISWENGTKRNTYRIYPKKGEVWAVFKGWDPAWSSDADSHRPYEYEVVEVLSDLSSGSDFQVVRLVKLRGFVSLFMRSAEDEHLRICLDDALKFSHQVPSYRTSGSERDGVPEGCFELDTASLPINFEEVFPSVNLDSASIKPEKLDTNNTRKHGKMDEDGMKSTTSRPHPASPPESTSADSLDNEFHVFQEDRTIGNFRPGQIWALFNEIDEYPKFYAKINIVDIENNEISFSWMELLPRTNDEKAWAKKGLPVACGRFRVEESSKDVNTPEAFSHVVHAEPVKGGEYDIYPRRGEVWALFKDWSVRFTKEDLSECKHDVVEVIEVTGSAVKFVYLTRVEGYNVVFMPEMAGDGKRVAEVSLCESMKFSHHIPAFRLTGEAEGSLHGYWELDASSLPNRKFM